MLMAAAAIIDSAAVRRLGKELPGQPSGGRGWMLDYLLLMCVRQPHLQFVDWHRHAPLRHPQEQLAQSQAPQQVVLVAVWSVVFFWFAIVFLLCLF